MRELLKYILLVLSIGLQLTFIVMLFFNPVIAWIAFGLFIVSFCSLITVFIVERKQEKKEEKFDDYRDY